MTHPPPVRRYPPHPDLARALGDAEAQHANTLEIVGLAQHAVDLVRLRCQAVPLRAKDYDAAMKLLIAVGVAAEREMTRPVLSAEQVDVIARACHEAHRAWCLACGDTSQRNWEEAEEWQRESARSGVAVAVTGAPPRQQHEAWARDKAADGWTYGSVKDATAKTHPCLVDYDALPADERAKDTIYGAVVRAFAAAFREVPRV